VNTTLNTATVAYYTGTTAGSRACFVCNNGSRYAPNTTISNERVCQNDGRWSRAPVVCGMLEIFEMYYIQSFEPCRAYIDTCMCEPQGSVRFWSWPIQVFYTVAEFFLALAAKLPRNSQSQILNKCPIYLSSMFPESCNDSILKSLLLAGG